MFPDRTVGAGIKGAADHETAPGGECVLHREQVEYAGSNLRYQRRVGSLRLQ